MKSSFPDAGSGGFSASFLGSVLVSLVLGASEQAVVMTIARIVAQLSSAYHSSFINPLLSTIVGALSALRVKNANASPGQRIGATFPVK
jgi:hypothetical protein